MAVFLRTPKRERKVRTEGAEGTEKDESIRYAKLKFGVPKRVNDPEITPFIV